MSSFGRHWRAEVLQCKFENQRHGGDFRGNFEEIPTLPEQMTVKPKGFYSAARVKLEKEAKPLFRNDGGGNIPPPSLKTSIVVISP
jgi:hypothetical protein